MVFIFLYSCCGNCQSYGVLGHIDLVFNSSLYIHFLFPENQVFLMKKLLNTFQCHDKTSDRLSLAYEIYAMVVCNDRGL